MGEIMPPLDYRLLQGKIPSAKDEWQPAESLANEAHKSSHTH